MKAIEHRDTISRRVFWLDILDSPLFDMDNEDVAQTLSNVCEILNRQNSIEDDPAPHAHWIYKHRHRGGFRYVTGIDDMGVEHTIRVDERYEVDDPYCSICGHLAGDMSLDHCYFCKAKMDESEDAYETN